LVLNYTITENEIRLDERRHENVPTRFIQYPGPLNIGVKSACTHDLSVLNVDGKMVAETDVNYTPSEEIGVVACIQMIDNPGCMVFTSDQNFKLNCSPRIVDVLFIQSHIPFSYKYADRSEVKRIDIFMQHEEAERLLSPALLNKLDEHDMIAIKPITKNKMVEELLTTIGKKLHSEHLCEYLHEIIVCLNEVGTWRSRF
jgi:hypothetical protein